MRAEDVYTFLEAQALAGGATGWTLTLRRVLDDPATDKQVVVTEDGGPTPETKRSSGIGDSALADGAVQVRVRAEAWDGDTAMAKAKAIFDALHGQHRITVGATQYHRVRAMTPEPVFIGFDDKGRPSVTISFMMSAFL